MLEGHYIAEKRSAGGPGVSAGLPETSAPPSTKWCCTRQVAHMIEFEVYIDPVSLCLLPALRWPDNIHPDRLRQLFAVGWRPQSLTPSLDAIAWCRCSRTPSARPLVINGDSTVRLASLTAAAIWGIGCDGQITLPRSGMAKMSSFAAAITTSI